MISQADYAKYHQICAKDDRDRRKGFKTLIPKPDSFGVIYNIYIYIYFSSMCFVWQ